MSRAMNGGIYPSVRSRGAKAEPWRPRSASFNQRTPAFVQRPESLIGRNGRANLVIVVRALRLRGLLDFHQIRRMKLAAFHAHSALTEERIVRRQFLHLGDHLGAVVAFQRLDRLEVVRDRRIHARLDHGRILAVVRRGDALGEGAGLVVQVPVEGLCEDQPLRLFEAEAMDVRQEHQQPREILPALDDAELGRLLDRVDGVAPGVRQADDLRLGRLRLQQERGEILARERMPHPAEHLAAVLQHHCLGVALEREAEGVVGGEEEPSAAAGLDDRRAGAVGEHPGVVGPMDGVGEHALPVRSEVAAPDTMNALPFSRVIWLIARAIDEVGTSMMRSTLSTSYHWRAMLEPTSGLFRWSADKISTFMPFFAAPKSSTAMRAAATDPGPVISEYTLDMSFSTPILTTPSEICACAREVAKAAASAIDAAPSGMRLANMVAPLLL